MTVQAVEDFRAVKATSRSQWNDAYGVNSGPSRGGPFKDAIRPLRPSEFAQRRTAVDPKHAFPR